MPQADLSRWFGGLPKKTAEPPIYFYLNWTGSKPTQLSWLDTLPTGVTHQRTLTLRDGSDRVTVVLCARLPTETCSDPCSDFTDVAKPESYREYTNVPLLKSHLQKCIRRGLDDKAVRTAFHLMRLDITAFCRRLPIIGVEDTGIHFSLGVVVWWMMAQPNIPPNKSVIRYLLGVVRHLALSPNYDRKLLTTPHPAVTIKQVIKLPPGAKKTLLLSLFARKCYGGMKGDTRLLQSIIEYWSDQPGTTLPTRMVTPISRVQIQDYLSLSELELSAADFHCFPNILNLIHRHFPRYQIDEIKKAIWAHSSSKNVREPYQPKPTDLVVWQEIEACWRRLAYASIRRCY